MSTIYITNSWSPYSKGPKYWNEYRLEGNRVVKYRCSSIKYFDGKENIRESDDKEVESWELNDPNMPEWLKNYI